MVKLTPTGVKINTNLVWTSHNTGGVEFNTGVFAVKGKKICKRKGKEGRNQKKIGYKKKKHTGGDPWVTIGKD